MSNTSKLTETWSDSNVKKGYVLMIAGKQAKARKVKNKRERQNRKKGRK